MGVTSKRLKRLVFFFNTLCLCTTLGLKFDCWVFPQGEVGHLFRGSTLCCHHLHTFGFWSVVPKKKTAQESPPSFFLLLFLLLILYHKKKSWIHFSLFNGDGFYCSPRKEKYASVMLNTKRQTHKNLFCFSKYCHVIQFHKYKWKWKWCCGKMFSALFHLFAQVLCQFLVALDWI